MMVHGTQTAYALGCRCDRCRTCQNDRVRRDRAQRLAAGRLSHGTRSAYDAGCRCEPCKGARREAYARLRSERPRLPWSRPTSSPYTYRGSGRDAYDGSDLFEEVAS